MFPIGPLPSPTDNPYNCPLCGYRPCAAGCSIGFSIYEVEIYLDLLLANTPYEPEPDEGESDE